jgi:hypothetical protein
VKGTVFPHALQLRRGYSTVRLVRYHGNMPKEMIFNEKLNLQVVEKSAEI